MHKENKRMKQYEVEVMGKYSHGCYGKEHYFGMVVSTESCKQAEMFADDILYEMTYEEFFDRCINSFKNPYARELFMTERKAHVLYYTQSTLQRPHT